MPKVHHKGQSRRFTSAEELEEDRKAEERARQFQGTEEGEDAPGGLALPVPKKAATGDDPEEEVEGEEEEEDSDEDHKHKGISHLIEVSNPNRVSHKPKKASQIGLDGQGPSRKEKEQLEADRMRIQAERKQAEADLARLAIIRKQREEEERKIAEQRRLKDQKGMPASTSPSGQSGAKR